MAKNENWVHFYHLFPINVIFCVLYNNMHKYLLYIFYSWNETERKINRLLKLEITIDRENSLPLLFYIET